MFQHLAGSRRCQHFSRAGGPPGGHVMIRKMLPFALPVAVALFVAG